MSIPLGLSPRLIPNIASLYTDPNRIFMEYIDNSIDSAESFYDVAKNEYTRPIKIILEIQGDSYRNGKVVISDNCLGITNFTKVVQSIGNSDKKADFTTNGQFGFGVYSFMAACEKLEITSKTEEQSALYIPIEKEQFNADKQEDVSFPDPKEIDKLKYQHGTEICLTGFEKDTWKDIDIQKIKSEIEKHFELLIGRKNLSIKLTCENSLSHSGRSEYICKPFNYKQYEGDEYKDDVDKLIYTKRGRSPEPVTLKLSKPIHIFVKVTKGKEINKRPVFVCKGRRIAEIKDIKGFRSNHKSDLWDHPNVTGYIDLSDFLEPTIARDDFKNSDKKRALFGYLIEIEPLILDVVKDVNKTSEERHYQELEDRLNQVLSKLARIDMMNYRTDYISGNNINLQKGGAGQSIEEGSGSKDTGENHKIKYPGGGIGGNDGEGKGLGGTSGNVPGGNEGEYALNKETDNPFEDSDFKGGEKKKSGFNIRIDDREPDIDLAKNEPMRSNIYGGEIRIFKQHPDFQKRIDVSRRGEPRISQRLITYLAGEITVHYQG